jgi:hypothetical protein
VKIWGALEHAKSGGISEALVGTIFCFVLHLIDSFSDFLLAALLAHACHGLECQMLANRQVAEQHLRLVHKGCSPSANAASGKQ